MSKGALQTNNNIDVFKNSFKIFLHEHFSPANDLIVKLGTNNSLVGERIAKLQSTRHPNRRQFR